MPATLTELATQVLEDLQVVPEGQAAEADDLNRVSTRLPFIIAALRAREIVTVSDTTAIPDEWVTDLGKVCAWELKNLYGVAGDFLQTLALGNSEGIGNLKVITRGKPTGEILRTLSY